MKKSAIPSLILSALLLLAAGGGASLAQKQDAPEKSHDLSFQRNLYVFNALARALEESYVDSIRTDDAFKAAIGAMLSTVDPYTEYYDSDSKDALAKMTTGEWGGIGSFILERDGATYISEPIEGSPAHKAGLRAGDRIVRVDTASTAGMKSGEVSTRLKGQPGTDVHVEVVRPFAKDSLLSFDITREKVKERGVPYFGLLDGGIGYVRLTSFIDTAAEEVEAALDSLRAMPGLNAIALDLRGNGGGLVEQAVDIVGFFVPKNTVVLRTRGRGAADEKVYKTTRNPIMPDIPLAVLIDGGSASASEITAGALQDLDRAILLGTQSFGKGLVQGTRELPYDGLLKVTVAKYYIPSGRLIQALDYSRRNPDGSVARTPDSLTNAYRTAHGREVRDGGGLRPDSVLDWGEARSLLYDLVTSHTIFDYATRYAASHPSIGDPRDFSISDADYEAFIAEADTSKLSADREALELLTDLRKTVKDEGFLSDSIASLLDSLEPALQPDLRRDLRNNRREVMDMINGEIAMRYALQSGRAANETRNDVALRALREILAEPGRYSRMLRP